MPRPRCSVLVVWSEPEQRWVVFYRSQFKARIARARSLWRPVPAIVQVIDLACDVEDVDRIETEADRLEPPARDARMGLLDMYVSAAETLVFDVEVHPLGDPNA